MSVKLWRGKLSPPLAVFGALCFGFIFSFASEFPSKIKKYLLLVMVVDSMALDPVSSMAGNYFIKVLWRSYGLSHEISEFIINGFLSGEKFIFCEIPGVLLRGLERNRFDGQCRVFFFPFFFLLEKNIFLVVD